MSVTAMKAKNAVESLREIVQDLVVPDLKAVKIEIESHRRETKVEFDSVRNEIKNLAESLRTEMRLRDEKQTHSIEALSDKLSQAAQALSDKIGYTTDIRERLAILEDRGKRLS